MLWAIISVVAAYLIGSINFAIIFSKLFTKRDVRELGSGNAGATNVLRTAGLLPGILTFVFDALKGFAACFLGEKIFVSFAVSADKYSVYVTLICGLFCMLGHVFPLFFRFKGGKGVAVAVGIFALCCPTAIIIGLICFALCLLISKIVSLSSLISTLVVVLLSIILYNKDASLLLQALPIILMGFIVFIKHSENIKRLIKGEEKHIKIGRKKNV